MSVTGKKKNEKFNRILSDDTSPLNLSIAFAIYYHWYYVIIRSRKKKNRRIVDIKECAYKKSSSKYWTTSYNIWRLTNILPRRTTDNLLYYACCICIYVYIDARISSINRFSYALTTLPFLYITQVAMTALENNYEFDWGLSLFCLSIFLFRI